VLTLIGEGGDLVGPASPDADGATGQPDAFTLQLGPDCVRPIDVQFLGIDLGDLAASGR